MITTTATTTTKTEMMRTLDLGVSVCLFVWEVAGVGQVVGGRHIPIHITISLAHCNLRCMRRTPVGIGGGWLGWGG